MNETSSDNKKNQPFIEVCFFNLVVLTFIKKKAKFEKIGKYVGRSSQIQRERHKLAQLYKKKA